MKVWGALLISFLAFSLLQAQSFPWPAGLDIPAHQSESNFNSASAPAYINASEFEGGLLRFWPLRMANQPTDTSILYAVVAFDTLIGPATPGTSPKSLDDVEIDSVGLLIYHVKTSSIPTRCVLDLLPLSAEGFPLAQAWYSDTLLWMASVATPAKRVWIPVQAYPPSNQAWAVRFRLLDLGAGDTLQLAARHPVKDTCGNLIQADTSAFYPNSFAYWQGYNLLLPSQSGGDFYTDCNGNGQRDSSDGANPIQTWDIALSVQATGLNLPNFTANQPALVYPNPCSEQVHVGLPGCSWDLWDALGKRRASGVGKAILSCKNLPAGCYVVGIRKDTTFWKEKLCVH
jgi:hypothetical protein